MPDRIGERIGGRNAPLSLERVEPLLHRRAGIAARLDREDTIESPSRPPQWP